TFPQELGGLILVTVHPERVTPVALSTVDVVVAVGEAPRETVESFCRSLGESPPAMDAIELEPREVLTWFRHGEAPPFRLRLEPARADRRRHRRKYAEGDLGPDSFYFRGPEGKLK